MIAPHTCGPRMKGLLFPFLSLSLFSILTADSSFFSSGHRRRVQIAAHKTQSSGGKNGEKRKRGG